MRKRTVKTAGLAVLAAGCVFGFGGCLNFGGLFGSVLRGAPVALAIEYLTDNSAVFDLFPDSTADTTANAAGN